MRRDVGVWTRASGIESDLIHHLYRSEVLHAAQLSLFGGTGSQCSYLTLSPEFIRACFASPAREPVTPALFDGRGKRADGAERLHQRLGTMRPDFANARLGELWLSPLGVGVLSIGLDMAPMPLDFGSIQTLVYGMSQSEQHRSPWLMFGRHEDSLPICAQALEALPVEHRTGRPNHGVRLSEWCDFLMNTLFRAGLELVSDREFRRFGTYTVVGHPQFGRAAIAPDAVRTFAASLAQAEEKGHPGTAPGSEAVATEWLDALTLGSVSTQGAARLHGFQGNGFDQERGRRNRDRAFIPYLSSLIQRLALERIRGSVTRALADARGHPWTRLRAEIEPDHRDLVELTATTLLSSVSTRDTYNRWYDLSRLGNRVEGHYRELLHVLNSIDATAQREEQAEQARHATASLQGIEDLQAQARESARRTEQVVTEMKDLQSQAATAAKSAEFLEAAIVGFGVLEVWVAFASAGRLDFTSLAAIGAVIFVTALLFVGVTRGKLGSKHILYALLGLALIGVAYYIQRSASPPPALDAVQSPMDSGFSLDTIGPAKLP